MAAVGVNNNFIVNITELQNVVTSASGLTPVATLTTQVSQLQEMINYSDKQIKANTISKFSGTGITFTDPVLFTSNVTFPDSASTATGSAQFAAVSTVGYYSSFTNYFSTVGAGDTAISFQVGSPPAASLSLKGDGTTVIAGGLTISGAGTPGLGKYLTCMDGAGTAQWQVPAMPSDMRWKEEIQVLSNYAPILEAIRGVRFRWSHDGARDIGVIAQDLLPVIPEAVIEGVDGAPMLVAYQKLIPVLVEAVKDLKARVEALEGLEGH